MLIPRLRHRGFVSAHLLGCAGRLAARWAVMLVLVWTGLLGRVAAAEADQREFQIKAAALYNLIFFVEWPPTAFAAPDAPFVICLLGSDQIGTMLGTLVEGESVQGHPILVEREPSLAAYRSCHLLYVSRPAHDSWPELAPRFTGRPVLTVSEAPDFLRQGGVVQLRIERNRLRLGIHLEHGREGGLTFSSKVLRLADVVGEP